MKQCRVCGETKPLDQFAQNKAIRDGLDNRCKTCRRAYDQAYSARNAEKRRAVALAWQKANRERDRANHRARWIQKRAHDNAMERKRYVARRDHYQQYRKRWHESHDGARQITRLKWRLRRLGRGDEPVFTLAEWTDLCNQFDGRCAGCGARKRLTVDHVIPLSRMGISTINNIQPLCRSCNSRKYTAIIDYRVRIQPPA